MNEKHVTFNVTVDVEQLAWEITRLSYDDAIGLIMQIDLQMADVGFTENLLVRLAKSMKKEVEGGLTLDEIDELNFIDWSKVK